MLDNIMNVIKLIVFLALVISTRKYFYGNGNDRIFRIWQTLFGFIVFVTGMEIAAQSDTPWQFLASEASLSEWAKSLLGGSVMLIFTFFMCGLQGPILNYLSNRKKMKTKGL